MNAFGRAAPGAAVMILLAACQPQAQDTSADEAEIRKSISASNWATAFNAGDVDAIVAMYADDAVLQPPGAPAAAGRAAIREFMVADNASSRAAGYTLHMADGTIGISGDLAYEAATFSVTDASGATVDTGKSLSVARKRDGKWLMIRDTWNSDRPPAPPPAAPAAAPPAPTEAPGG
jgi:uncharacterized protein (TIGR02246 family)